MAVFFTVAAGPSGAFPSSSDPGPALPGSCYGSAHPGRTVGLPYAPEAWVASKVMPGAPEQQELGALVLQTLAALGQPALARESAVAQVAPESPRHIPPAPPGC